MINGVYTNLNNKVAFKSNNTYADDKMLKQEVQNDEVSEISSEASSAYRAYGHAMVQKPLEKLSLNDCIQQLQKQGKVEGKDYRLENYENGNVAIYVLNKDGQEAKRMLFDEGKIDCWEDYKYSSNGKLAKTISHHGDGKIPSYSDYYYNDEIPQEVFTKDKLTFNTTPEEYIEYLNKNNKNYKVLKEEGENGRSVSIQELNKAEKIIQTTIWDFYGNGDKIVCRNLFDENEAITKRITFDDDRTDVCTHLEKWGKGKNYLKTEVPQETFTKEHITAETTPDEYIQYLRENNKKFEVVNKKDWTLIKEFDNNGKEIQSTGFDNDKWKYPPDYSIIMREEFLPNGNRKRISFSKTDTYVEKFSYN